MKKLLIAMILMIMSVVLVFSGCVIQLGEDSGTAVQMNNSGDVDSLPGTITVTKGSNFAFSLEGNMTTGFSWQVYIDDEEIVKLVSNVYEPEDSDLEGSGGVSVITLEALRKGETMITLEYAQNWDGGEVDKTREIEIVVE